MAAIQAICDLARLSLNDDAKGRWTDTELAQYAGVACLQGLSLRPDLAIGSYTTPPTLASLSVVGGTFPLPDKYQRAVADYVIARALAVNTEGLDTQTADSYMKLFASEMMS